MGWFQSLKCLMLLNENTFWVMCTIPGQLRYFYALRVENLHGSWLLNDQVDLIVKLNRKSRITSFTGFHPPFTGLFPIQTDSISTISPFLAPAVPLEAEFEDMAPVIDLGSLAPATPAKADFSDGADQMINIAALAPETPTVADFG